MHWQGDLPFVQGTRFISDPRQGHFFLDLLNAEEKMELDPKPDENLIANSPTPCPLFPLGRHNLLFPRILYYVWREPLFFSLRDGPAFAEVDYVVCFPDDILSRGLSLTWWLRAVGRMGWVFAVLVLWEGQRPCWGAGGIHTLKGKEVSEYVLNFHGFFKQSLSNPGLNSAWSGGN